MTFRLGRIIRGGRIPKILKLYQLLVLRSHLGQQVARWALCSPPPGRFAARRLAAAVLQPPCRSLTLPPAVLQLPRRSPASHPAVSQAPRGSPTPSRGLCAMSSGTRCSSAPPGVGRDAGSGRERQDAVHPHTLGVPGADSPTGRDTAYILWKGLLDTTIWCTPKLTVSWEQYGPTMNHVFIWIIIWWHPEKPCRGMMRPEKWHTTLTRATWRTPATEQALARIKELESVLSYVLGRCLPASPYPLTLARPPWKKSWNFGVGPDTHDACLVVRALGDQLFKQFWDLAVQEHREIHISWH